MNCVAHSALEQETGNSSPFSMNSIMNRFWIKNGFELKIYFGIKSWLQVGCLGLQIILTLHMDTKLHKMDF